jgi:hypothetical protein
MTLIVTPAGKGIWKWLDIRMLVPSPGNPNVCRYVGIYRLKKKTVYDEWTGNGKKQQRSFWAHSMFHGPPSNFQTLSMFFNKNGISEYFSFLLHTGGTF